MSPYYRALAAGYTSTDLYPVSVLVSPAISDIRFALTSLAQSVSHEEC